jgi:hypothetical protein
LFVVLALAGCGGVQGSSQFGDVPLVLQDKPSADEAGVFLATQRGYDEAEGVTFQVARSGNADFRLVTTPPKGCIAVMAIVRPSKLVLCADEITLQDERPKVLAVVRALSRGYEQAQLEPDAAVAAMDGRVPGVTQAQMEAAAPTWTEGAPYFGQLTPGPGRDSTVARDARKEP